MSMSSPHDPPPAAPGLRRPYSAPAGRPQVTGEPEVAGRLLQAMTVPPWPEHMTGEERRLCEASLGPHLFHSFSARSHPLTVRHLLDGVGAGQKVYDPFAGSGTTLVEAALRGAGGIGADLGELQVRLSRFKATPMPAGMRASLLRRAEQVSEASYLRVRKRQRPVRTAPWDEARHYEPHIYLELCGLREEIARAAAQDPPIGEALLLIFSSLVLKFSRQRAESSEREVERALGKGQPSRWLRRKTEEVVRLLAAFADRVPPGTPRPVLWQRDARLGPPEDQRTFADVIVTSPPYLGVYDYAAHQARRCAWLGIDQSAAEAGEIGARRHGASLPAEQVRRYEEDTDAWIAQAARALAPQGVAYVLVGDGSVDHRMVPGDRPVLQAAERAGLSLLAGCSVERPPLPGLPPRREHLLAFRCREARPAKQD